MLRESEHLDALKLIQAIGQRHSGHFDHDASRWDGADPYPATRDGAVEECQSNSESTTAGPFEAFVDPETGDVLYRKIE